MEKSMKKIFKSFIYGVLLFIVALGISLVINILFELCPVLLLVLTFILFIYAGYLMSN